MLYHRCRRHERIEFHNLNAEDGTAECGACIMREVAWLVKQRLDLLETIAGLLHQHALLRTTLSDRERRLAAYEHPTLSKES